MESKVLAYANEKKWQYKQIRGGIQLACPFEDCDDNHAEGHHFYIYFDNEIYKCMKCGNAGHLLKLKRLLGDLDFIQQESGQGKTLQIDLADQMHQVLMKDRTALEYLYSRGFNNAAIAKYKIGLTFKQIGSSNERCIVFPTFKDGKLTNLKYKSMNKFDFKNRGEEDYYIAQEAGCTPRLFGGDKLDPKSKTVVVVEGEYDLLAAEMYHIKNVVSVPSGATGFGSWVEDLDKFENIYLMFDNDKMGEEGAEKLAEKVGRYRCSRIRLPLKDLNECLNAGMSGKELQKYIDTATKYSDEAVVEINKVIDKVDNLYANAEKAKGFPTGLKQLDHTLGGYRDAEVTVISGDTTAGKTTFVLNCIYHALRRDVGVLIVSSEVLVEKVLAKLMSIHAEEDFYNREKFSKAMYDRVREWLITKNIFFVDVHAEIQLRRLEDAIEFTTRFHNVKMVMLDHLHFFLEDVDNEYREISKFTKGIEKIAKHTKSHIFLIVHPKQLDDPEQLREHGMAFLRGGSPIKQNADNVAILWRDKDAEEKGIHHVELIWKKVRDDTGHEGTCHFYFNAASQKYSEERPKLPEKITKPKKKEPEIV